jgi:hypothetical protein
MSAPKGNKNAEKTGVSKLIRVRLPTLEHFELLAALTDTDTRGTALWELVQTIKGKTSDDNPETTPTNDQ